MCGSAPWNPGNYQEILAPGTLQAEKDKANFFSPLASAEFCHVLAWWYDMVVISQLVAGNPRYREIPSQ